LVYGKQRTTTKIQELAFCLVQSGTYVFEICQQWWRLELKLTTLTVVVNPAPWRNYPGLFFLLYGFNWSWIIYGLVWVIKSKADYNKIRIGIVSLETERIERNNH